MATFTLVEGTNVGPSPFGNGPNTEAALAQQFVNNQMGQTKKGLTIVWVYDDSARTLTATFSGTAA